MSRLQREIESAVELYRAEPPETRARIEEALRICSQTLVGADRAGSISEKTKAAFRTAIESIVLTGFLGASGWKKVHAALAAAAPALYAELKGVLPGAGDQSVPF